MTEPCCGGEASMDPSMATNEQAAWTVKVVSFPSHVQVSEKIPLGPGLHCVVHWLLLIALHARRCTSSFNCTAKEGKGGRGWQEESSQGLAVSCFAAAVWLQYSGTTASLLGLWRRCSHPFFMPFATPFHINFQNFSLFGILKRKEPLKRKKQKQTFPEANESGLYLLLKCEIWDHDHGIVLKCVRRKSFRRPLWACPWMISRRSCLTAHGRQLLEFAECSSGMHPRKAQKPELRQAREQAAKESVGDAFNGETEPDEPDELVELQLIAVWLGEVTPKSQTLRRPRPSRWLRRRKLPAAQALDLKFLIWHCIACILRQASSSKG